MLLLCVLMAQQLSCYGIHICRTLCNTALLCSRRLLIVIVLQRRFLISSVCGVECSKQSTEIYSVDDGKMWHVLEAKENTRTMGNMKNGMWRLFWTKRTKWNRICEEIWVFFLFLSLSLWFLHANDHGRIQSFFAPGVLIQMPVCACGILRI